MKRFSTLLLLASALCAATAADAPKGFAPLTPDGRPGDTNLPAVSLRMPGIALAPIDDEPGTPSVRRTPSAKPATDLDDVHRLVATDRLTFQILEDRHIPPELEDVRTSADTRDLGKTLIVTDTGELDVPYIGRVKVKGKTCKEAAAEITILLEKDYYYQATVILGLDQMSRVLGKVYVSGHVRNPGPVEIPPNEKFTVSKAILRVGGFTDWASKSEVMLIPDRGTAKDAIIINMKDVLEKGMLDKDVELHPEDRIIVPKKTWNFGN